MKRLLVAGLRSALLPVALTSLSCLSTTSGAADPVLTAIVDVRTSVRPRPYSNLLFGGFLEHFHRQIYGGIYGPGSPLSDTNGFR